MRSAANSLFLDIKSHCRHASSSFLLSRTLLGRLGCKGNSFQIASLQSSSSPFSTLTSNRSLSSLQPSFLSKLPPSISSVLRSKHWISQSASIQASSSMASGTEALASKEVEATSSGEDLKVIFVHNTEVVKSTQTAGEFLGSSPRGAYTTARTVDRNSIFEFEFHVARLAQSVELMMEADAKSGSTVVSLGHLTKVESLRPLVLNSLQAGLSAFSEMYADYQGELKITMLLTWTEQKHDLFIHLTTLPLPPSPPVKVEIRGHPRSNAAAKDSEWVRQRKTLEASKPADVNEILLMGEDGSVLEGMTSNFFVVQKGIVVTAPDGVLLGTVREVALAVCKREGIEVLLQAPNVKDCDSWEGAFITSTSRLVLPIDELRIPNDQDVQSYRFEESLVHKLSQLVKNEIASNSTRVV